MCKTYYNDDSKMLKYVDNMKTGYKQFINILNHANMLKLLKSIVRMLKYCRIV